MAVTDVKCPVCARPSGAACIRLGYTPDNRITWISVEPHLQRRERARE